MKYSSSDKIINTNNRIKENINREILEKLKKKIIIIKIYTCRNINKIMI